MASLALIAASGALTSTAATGTALVSAGGMAALGMAAAFIDTRILLPAFFPVDDPIGPKIDGMRITPATDGTPASLIFGEEWRDSGAVVWASDFYKTTEPSSKGGGYEVELDEYRVDAAIALCKNEIEAVLAIRNQSTLIYENVGNTEFTSSSISATQNGNYCELKQTALPGLEGPHLGDRLVGYPIRISGFARNGTFDNSTPSTPNSLFFVGAHTAVPGLTQAVTLDAAGAGLTGTVSIHDSFVIDHGGLIGEVRYKFTGGATAAGNQIAGTVRPALADDVPDNTEVVVESGTNGVYTVLASFTTGAPNLDGICRVANVHSVNESGGETITISQDGLGFPGDRLTGVTVHTGTDYQEPDALLEGYLGVGNVPAARGAAYVVLQGLVVTDAGNWLGNLTFIVKAKTGETFATSASLLLSRAKMPNEFYDVTDVGSTLQERVRGYGTKGPTPTADTLAPLMVSRNILSLDNRGVLKFYPRDEVPSFVIDPADLGAYMPGQRRPDLPMRVFDVDDFDLPAEVRVAFVDPELNYQQGMVSQRVYGGTGDSPASANLNQTFDSFEARRIANRLAATPQVNRQRVKGSLPPSYKGIIGENRRGTVASTMGHDWTLLMQTVDIGANGLIEFEALVEEGNEDIAGETFVEFTANNVLVQPAASTVIEYRQPEIGQPGPWRLTDLIIGQIVKVTGFPMVGSLTPTTGLRLVSVATNSLTIDNGGATFTGNIWHGSRIRVNGLDFFSTNTPGGAAGNSITLGVVPATTGLGLTAGMTVDITGVGNGNFEVLTTTHDVVNNKYIAEVQGVAATIATSQGPSVAFTQGSTMIDEPPGQQRGGGFSLPAPVAGFILDLPPLKDEHATQFGRYIAASSYQPDRWTGAVVYQATYDGSATFEEVAKVKTRATIGFASDVLADATAGAWDLTNTVTVTLLSGELESVTEDAAEAGWNVALLGDEIIAFQTATLVDTRTYELSDILRGIRDTQDYTGTHTDTDRFILLDSAIQWLPMKHGEIGQTAQFKIAAPGQLMSGVTTLEVESIGRSVRPFAPTNLVSTPNAGDLDLTWDPVSRYHTRSGSSYGEPSADWVQSYEVDILDGVTVLRTYESDTPNATYTAADQVIDATADRFRVYTVTPLYGRGTYAEEML